MNINYRYHRRKFQFFEFTHQNRMVMAFNQTDHCTLSTNRTHHIVIKGKAHLNVDTRCTSKSYIWLTLCVGKWNECKYFLISQQKMLVLLCFEEQTRLSYRNPAEERKASGFGSLATFECFHFLPRLFFRSHKNHCTSSRYLLLYKLLSWTSLPSVGDHKSYISLSTITWRCNTIICHSKELWVIIFSGTKKEK